MLGAPYPISWAEKSHINFLSRGAESTYVQKASAVQLCLCTGLFAMLTTCRCAKVERSGGMSKRGQEKLGRPRDVSDWP